MKGSYLSAMLLLAVGLFFGQVGVAHAADTGQKDAGTFWCGISCTLDGSPVMNGDTRSFIVYGVNPYINSWITPSGSSRTVTICNSAGCETYVYVKSGEFALKSKETPLKEHDYKNGGPGGGGGGGGGAGGIGGDGGDIQIPPGVPVCYDGPCETGTVTVGPITNP